MVIIIKMNRMLERKDRGPMKVEVMRRTWESHLQTLHSQKEPVPMYGIGWFLPSKPFIM